MKREKGDIKMAINRFNEEYEFLSNFYVAEFPYNGERWKTVEHAFQAAKCADLKDAKMIKSKETPGQAKCFGRQVKMREDWDTYRVQVMRDLLRHKFLYNDDLLEGLLQTGHTKLIEGNTWHDNFWGQCTCSKCSSTKGQNMLGTLLMELRRDYLDGKFIWFIKGDKEKQFSTKKEAEHWLISTGAERVVHNDPRVSFMVIDTIN